MGNVRTPKPEYFDGGVVEFYVNKKQIKYKVILWSKDGLTQFEYETGNYESDQQIKLIIQRALRSFSSVEVNQR